jgi:CheY-like chemotaxis protein
VQHILCEIIQTAGYKVSGVSGAAQALQHVRQNEVDLVLTDLMMSEMDGWELLDAIKELNEEILVVVITGYVPEQAHAMLTDFKASGHLTKPAEQEQMHDLLHSLLIDRDQGKTPEVVIIDDDAAALFAVEQSLKRLGIHTATFQDPGFALQHIRQTLPHMAIVDLHIPNFSGFEVCRSIRSTPHIAQMPILILTAEPSRENVTRAMEFEVNGFIAKPFSPRELRDKVCQMLQQIGVSIERYGPTG